MQKELNEKLLSRVPEFKNIFDDYVKDQDGIETGSHIIFEDAIVPFIVELIENENDDVLQKLFKLFEEMANSSDEYEQEVLQLSILEPLKNNYDDLYDFTKLLLPKTLSLYQNL